MDGDYALALLRDLVKRRGDLRLILMSATLDSARFAAYFRGMYVAVYTCVALVRFLRTQYDNMLHIACFA